MCSFFFFIYLFPSLRLSPICRWLARVRHSSAVLVVVLVVVVVVAAAAAAMAQGERRDNPLGCCTELFTRSDTPASLPYIPRSAFACILYVRPNVSAADKWGALSHSYYGCACRECLGGTFASPYPAAN
jgi:hypothetical protein